MVLIALLALASGCTGASDEGTPNTEPAEPIVPVAVPFTRAVVFKCLVKGGASVARLRPADQELRGLRDLAQGTSFAVRVGKDSAALAFAANVAGAELLEELLTIPTSRYVVVRYGNVVVLHSREESAAPPEVTRCLSL